MRRVVVMAVPPSPDGTAPRQWAHQVDSDYFAEHPEMEECWRDMVPGEFAREAWQPAADRHWIVHVRKGPPNTYRRTVVDAAFLRAEDHSQVDQRACIGPKVLAFFPLSAE